MKIDSKAFAISCALVWAAYTALVYLGCRFFGIGLPWVKLLNSVYLGAHATIKGSAVAVLWAVVDGFIGGYIFATIYNLFSSEA